MIRLAGVPMGCPDEKLRDVVESRLDPNLAVPWASRSWPGLGMAALTVPTGFRVPHRVALNRLVWPSGASRWAHMFLLSSDNLLTYILEAVGGDCEKGYNRVPLEMSTPGTSGEGEVFRADMYVLPPQRVTAVVSSAAPSFPNNLYIVPIVDERYFWWDCQFPEVEAGEGLPWDEIFSACEDGLAPFGVEIDRPAIPPEYLMASSMFNLPYEPVPPILDAAAYNVGMRLSRGFDGSVRLQDFEGALDAIRRDFEANPARRVAFGGWRADPSRCVEAPPPGE